MQTIENKEPPPKRKLSSTGDNAAAKFTDVDKAFTVPSKSDVPLASDYTVYIRNIEQVSAQKDPQRSDVMIASNPNTENIETDPQYSYLITPDPDDENIEQKLTLLQRTDLSTCQI
ncbi:hypothetical protein Q5P01_005302 [Channa striata]|uniref:Uncharacterized protein n=1 Tax=Channa striata TaxID=64152 RepID=A0AA88NG55_CHASR|nr:hypothetical protein Q5P01_005302 [Channa striata]